VDGIPAKLIADYICTRRLAICGYAKYRHRSSSSTVPSVQLQTGQSLKGGPDRPRPAKLGLDGPHFRPISGRVNRPCSTQRNPPGFYGSSTAGFWARPWEMPNPSRTN